MNTSSLTLLGRGTQAQNLRSFTVTKERRTLEENFLVLISKFEKDPGKKSAIEICEACMTLLDEYKSTFNSTANIVKCYSTNMEQYLWKNVFYCVIEIFRKAMSYDSSALVKYNVILVKFIDQALKFYFELINQYETLILPQKFADVLYWPEGSSPFCVNLAFAFSHSAERSFTGDRKILLRSVQRHYLAVGDLFRYKSTLVDPATNVKLARRYYFKAAQANLHNGRAFNLLGVLASLSRNFLDMNFYYVLALSAKYPFNSARESLGIACNQVQQIPVLWKNTEKTKNVATKRRTAQKHNAPCEEVWIRPNEDEGKLVAKEAVSPPSFTLLDGKAQRDVLFKWLHLAGILLTNIGMEKFQALREQALHDFYELINMPESILTTTTLLKITLIFVFASHHIKPGASESSANLQCNYAIRVLLDIMATTVGVALDALNKLEMQPDSKNNMLNRILPSLSALCRWMISPTKVTAKLLKASDYFLDGTLLTDFALLFNKIKNLQSEGRFDRFGPCTEGGDSILLPEYVLMSSFHGIFPSSIPNFSLAHSSENSDSIEAITLDCRLYTIMWEAEAVFVQNELTLPHLSQLIANKGADGSLRLSNLPTIASESREKYENNGVVEKKFAVLNVEDDELLKKNLIGNKSITLSRKIILEICPKYLVPDTNTFIDHLELIKRIVDSKLYTVLVPTIVVTELSSLSTDMAGRRASGIVPQKLIALLSPELGPKSKARNVQMQYVMRQAGATIDYLKQASQERTPHLATITTNGNVLSRVSFAQEMLGADCPAQTNDDRILASCVELCNNNDEDSYNRDQSDAENENESIILKRNMVFLTEDRALCIKAVAARVPTRSAPQFIKWSGI